MTKSQHLGMRLMGTRFISICTHLLLLWASSLGPSPNVRAMLTTKDLWLRYKQSSSCVDTNCSKTALDDLLDKYMSDYRLVETFSFICISLEIVGFLYGASVMSSRNTMCSITCHLAGSFAMLGFVLDGWESSRLLAIFLLFCLPPFLGELTSSGFAIFFNWTSREIRSRRKEYHSPCAEFLEMFSSVRKNTAAGTSLETEQLLTKEKDEDHYHETKDEKITGESKTSNSKSLRERLNIKTRKKKGRSRESEEKKEIEMSTRNTGESQENKLESTGNTGDNSTSDMKAGTNTSEQATQ